MNLEHKYSREGEKERSKRDRERSQMSKNQAMVVQKEDSAIQQINRYSPDSAISFPNTYPLDSDLSGG